MPDPVTVRLRRFDGALIRQVTTLLLSSSESEIRLAVPFGTEFQTLKGPWRPSTAAIYRYFPGCWHNVCSVISADLEVVGLYCDVLTAPEFDGTLLAATDLDLDVWVNPDGSYRVMDEDEFAEHSDLFHYPERLQSGARTALNSILNNVAKRQGPFAGWRVFTLSDDERSAIGRPRR